MILCCPSTGGEPGAGDPEAGDGGEDQQRERGGGLRHREGLPPVLRRGAGRGHRQTRIRSTGSTGSSTVVVVVGVAVRSITCTVVICSVYVLHDTAATAISTTITVNELGVVCNII